MPEGERGVVEGVRVALSVLPLGIGAEDVDAYGLIPAVAVAALVAYLGEVVALDAVAVAEEGAVVFEGVEACP